MNRRLSKVPIGVAFGLTAALIAQGAAADAPAIAHLQYSADVGANIVGPASFAARKDFVDDDLAGTRLREQIAGLPDNVVLHDFHVESDGNILFALDIGATLGGTYYSPADVIRYSGSFSKEFDSVAAGVPAGVHCDGVARSGNGRLLLSFDKTFTVGGITIRPADVIPIAPAHSVQRCSTRRRWACQTTSMLTRSMRLARRTICSFRSTRAALLPVLRLRPPTSCSCTATTAAGASVSR